MRKCNWGLIQVVGGKNRRLESKIEQQALPEQSVHLFQGCTSHMPFALGAPPLVGDHALQEHLNFARQQSQCCGHIELLGWYECQLSVMCYDYETLVFQGEWSHQRQDALKLT